MSFINKEDVLKEVFFNEDTGRRKSNILQRMEFDKENFSITMEYHGHITKFYTDDQLNEFIEKNGGELPDNDDGSVMLFFNTSDALKIIEGFESDAARKGDIKIKSRMKDSSGHEIYTSVPAKP